MKTGRATAVAGMLEMECACSTARQTARVLTQFYDAGLREYGLETPQFALLMALEKMGSSSEIELSRRFLLEKTTVSRNLLLMKRKGWVECSVGGDRRTREFALTQAGRALMTQAKPAWKKAQSRLRASLPEGEWKAMFGVLRNVTRLVAGLQG